MKHDALPERTNGFSAIGLRRNCETLEAILWAAPRKRGSSMPSLGECGRGSFTDDASRPLDGARLRLGDFQELEQQIGIFVPRQQPEQDPVRQLE